MQLQEVPAPASSANQTLVNVETVGVNFADVMGTYGKYPGGPKPPYICGREFAGTVAATGERVMGYTQYGACGEQFAADPRLLFPVPPNWDSTLAAAFPVNYLTAWLCYWKGGLVSGPANDPSPINPSKRKRALIHAAAGGVGTAAVEIGRMLGVETFGTASSDEKLSRLGDLGLDHAINYTRDDYEKKIEELTSGEGVDIVFDGLGGEHTGKSLRCCGFLGRVIMYGTASGHRPKFDDGPMYEKAVSVHAIWLSRLASDRELIASALRSMQPWIESGNLKPVVGNVLPMEKAAEGFRMLADRKNFGKVVLKF